MKQIRDEIDDNFAQPKAESLSSYSPGQRPGDWYVCIFAPCKGKSPCVVLWPLQGVRLWGTVHSQGVALGYKMKAFQA